MRAWIIILALLVVASSGLAEPSTVPFGTIAAVTNATAGTNSVTCPNWLVGYVRGIDLNFAGTATATVDVDVVTLTTGGVGRERTIFSIDNITADATYFPQNLGHTTAGVSATNYLPIWLVSDKVKVDVFGANTTGITVNVDLIIDPRP